MCGAESAGRLDPPFVTETTTGTSPAPASDAGSSTMIWSKPGVSEGPTACIGPLTGSAVPVIVVVQLPVVCEPFGIVVVTANGSPEGATQGLVTFRTAARPPGPVVEVKISGCDALRSTDERMS